MNTQQGIPQTPQAKPGVENQQPNQLTEDGPDESQGKKLSPFRKFLNNLWGPIRG